MYFCDMSLFIAMSVDFLEFCAGMTSGKGPFHGLSHNDVEKILTKFQEYSLVRYHNLYIVSASINYVHKYLYLQ